MAIPTSVPTWATSATGLAATTTPTVLKEADGWAVAEKPAAQYFNWYFNLVGQWCQYLSTFLSTANTWTAVQTFSAGIGGGLNILGGFTVSGATLLNGATTLSGAVTLTSGANASAGTIQAPVFMANNIYSGYTYTGGALTLNSSLRAQGCLGYLGATLTTTLGTGTYGTYWGSATGGVVTNLGKFTIPPLSIVTGLSVMVTNNDTVSRNVTSVLVAEAYNAGGGWTNTYCTTGAGAGSATTVLAGASAWVTCAISGSPSVGVDGNLSLSVALDATTANGNFKFYGAHLTYTVTGLYPGVS